MTITYPYGVTVLADLLKIASVKWDIQRNDEMSGSGDGRVWQAELAPPLWKADVSVQIGYRDEVEQIAALLRKLHGAQESFYLYSPVRKYPLLDPTGSIVGSNEVKVHTASGANVRLKGLPASYKLSRGDKLQINYATSRNYFGEVSEDVTADGSGNTAAFGIFPHLPAGLAADDLVNLKKPACKMFLMAFDPGTSDRVFTQGMTFQALERRR